MRTAWQIGKGFIAKPKIKPRSLSQISAADGSAHDTEIFDYLTPTPSHLLDTLLQDLSDPDPQPHHRENSQGSSMKIQSPPRTLPQGHHLVYFPLQTPASKLAPDGADATHLSVALGPTAPSEEENTQRRKRKRLWAGGEISFSTGWESRLKLDGRPWLCREEVARKSRGGVVNVWRRHRLGHEVKSDEERWDIIEKRSLAFRTEGEGKPIHEHAQIQPSIRHRLLAPTRTHLFHFSALSYNAHAIHYDIDYARNVDHHRSLLVHGPLTLAIMIRHLVAHEKMSLRRIVYRNLAPLYVDNPIFLCLGPSSRDGDLPRRRHVWLEDPDGYVAVKADAEFEREALSV
ncbi:hypothetical protein CP533_1317 [Ophiocordyceps camponoti-saundersi (nom. inval.)]|nr:hypothetical protein CP533_1317 [Ophiocordyceps camponoti-saundersi (nom. inval.)]